jgi:hypothetical protein
VPETPLQQRIREQLGLRVGPETAAYLARQAEASPSYIPAMAGDARTGRPILAELDPDDLRAAMAAAAP